MSADELDLLEFFAVEPVVLEPGVPWFYNDSAYQTRDERCTLSFAVSPAAGDVRILLSVDGVALYELNARSVEDIRRHIDPRGESLEIRTARAASIWLRVKPHICISDIRDEVTGC